MRFLPFLVASAATVLSSACGGGAEPSEPGQNHEDVATDTCEEDEPFTANMSRTGAAGYDVTLVSSVPAPPERYDNTWVLRVRDPEDALVTDAELVVVPLMIEHGHGSNRDAIVTNHGDGTYTAERVNFMMPGAWDTTVRVEDAEGTLLDRVTFTFCIP
jgi:hypothetical protein